MTKFVHLRSGFARVKSARRITTVLLLRAMKNMNGVKNSIDDPNETTTLRTKLETFDDILPYVGDFGRYQWLLLLALFPYSVEYAVLYFSQFFLTLVPHEHWCRIDELISSNFTQEERIELSIPKSQNYPYYDQCHRKDLDFSTILSHRSEIRSIEWKTNKSVDCSKWEYNFTQIPYASIAAEVKYPRVCACTNKQRESDNENSRSYPSTQAYNYP